VNRIYIYIYIYKNEGEATGSGDGLDLYAHIYVYETVEHNIIIIYSNYLHTLNIFYYKHILNRRLSSYFSPVVLYTSHRAYMTSSRKI